MTAEAKGKELSDAELQEMVAAADTGARAPTNLVAAKIIVLAAFAWSVFQLWYASPLPFITGILNVNDAQARSIHLGFAVFLAFLAYPALKHSPRQRIPVQDWVLALVGAFCASYRFWFYDDLAGRPGLPIDLDIFAATVGLILLLEATRRSLGPPLMCVALLFMAYVFFGDAGWLPDMIRYELRSFARAMDQFWLSDQGVFGIALGVSTKFVFLFVLFGALLEKAGAGNYFIKVAFSLLGHLRGGPAKAAVVASGLTGLISGSSIANVVTTGTFTIPLMKRVGFTSEKAGAVEVASSVNGQIMPPVMGAAAFLMVEYVGIPYVEVIKHAFLPAIISYIALLYIVHLEALKTGMQGLPKPGEPLPAKWQMIAFLITVSSVLIIAGIAYFALQMAQLLDASGWVLAAIALVVVAQVLFVRTAGARAPGNDSRRVISTAALVLGNVVVGAVGLFHFVEIMKQLTGEAFGWVIALVVAAAYVALLAYAARYPELELDDPKSPMIKLPEPGPTVKSGLHFLLPIVVLVWNLMVERLSPGLSAFWATIFMVFIMITQRPLKLLLGGGGAYGPAFNRGLAELFDAMVAGARNMIGIGVATATAGIIVGTVGLTGIGLVMSAFVEFLSGGNLLVMLALVAVLSLILGMGLPTTANYIVVSALMAPVIVSLGAQSGLIVPLIAVHLFVFYFGIMADVTPPVGLASFAAAAVSGGDPIKTGFTAFFYSLRTVALPFMFIFNTQLILYEIGGAVELILTVLAATIAMLVFAAATQGYFMVRSRIWESLVLLLVAFTLFRPGFWMDMIFPPLESVAGNQIHEIAEGVGEDESLRVVVHGMTLEGDEVTRTVLLPMGAAGRSGEERLSEAGMELRFEDDRAIVDFVMFGSPAQDLGVDFDFEIVEVVVALDVPPKELMFIPAMLVLAGVIVLQNRRRERVEPQPAPA